jgi:hypothetical protein
MKCSLDTLHSKNPATGMNYFYETQPNPNPVAYYAHQLPQEWHTFETFGNHVVELVLPLLTIVPLR